MRLKDEHLAFSSGIGLASCAIGYLEEKAHDAFEIFKDEILECIIKPNKQTALHVYLMFFQDTQEDMSNLDGSLEERFNRTRNLLNEIGMHPELRMPEFHECEDSYSHEECACECDEIVEEWFDYVYENANLIDEIVIHSAFQILFQDRRFLHDFHIKLAEFIESQIAEIKQKYPDDITQRNRIKRKAFPEWLKKAVYHRDKGTCTFCRCDLSHLVRIQNTKHIDHIVPLALFGSNDASNYQLLCETCNTSKGAHSTDTNSVNVPFWNMS
ncbi:HNH endonuclease [Bacillus cereus]|nr:HNH endonuclease [Bacillus cereus]